MKCVQKKEVTENNGRNTNIGNGNFTENKVSEQKSSIREF